MPHDIDETRAFERRIEIRRRQRHGRIGFRRRSLRAEYDVGETAATRLGQQQQSARRQP